MTKRALSFASRFEDFVDTLAFHVVASLLPLAFASVVLWRYAPLLVVVLISPIVVTGLVIAPLIRRRQALVHQREAAIARVSGHVADSLMNMETVRAFAAEDREAAEHKTRVGEARMLAIRSWDYANLRIDTVVAPMSVLTNALGLFLAVSLGGGQLAWRRSRMLLVPESICGTRSTQQSWFRICSGQSLADYQSDATSAV